MQTLSKSDASSVCTAATAACPLETLPSGEASDLSWIRSCFPVITNNPDKIFFDNAATSQKPYLVVEKINEFHAETCANAGRGSYSWSTRLDRSIEESRTAVASLLNADKDAIAFTGGATDSLNMVANYWGLANLRDGDEIMVCADDHRSAVMPWYNLKHVLERFGIRIQIVPFEIHPTGTYDRKSIVKALSERTRLIALAHVHHLYGMEMDISELKGLIPNEVLISLDGSQSIGHMHTDLESLAVDFFSFSGHKMFASNGVGVLWTSDRVRQQLWPMRVGAKSKSIECAGSINFDRTALANIVECGTLNIPSILSLGAAAKFIQSTNILTIHEHVSGLTRYLLQTLRQIPALAFAPGIGVCDCTKGFGIISFRIAGISSADLGAYLDSENIFVRTGDFCLGRQSGEDEFIRISLHVYNTHEEIDRLVEVLKDAVLY